MLCLDTGRAGQSEKPRSPIAAAASAAYPGAAGDARPSGGQTIRPSASGMCKLRNNKENIIQLRTRGSGGVLGDDMRTIVNGGTVTVAVGTAFIPAFSIFGSGWKADPVGWFTR